MVDMQYSDGIEDLVAGRIKNVRSLGHILFIDINAEGRLVQGVFREDLLGKDKYTESQHLKEGDVIRVCGVKVPSKKRSDSIDVASYTILSKNLTD